METLLESLKQSAAEERTAALATYRQLLARSNDPQPGDVEDLAEVCRTLGLVMQDVEADAKALARAERGRGMILPLEAIERLRRDVPRVREEARRALVEAMKSAIDRITVFEDAVRLYAVVGHARDLPPHPAAGLPEAAEQSVVAAERLNAQVREGLWQLATDHPRVFDDPGPRPWNPQTDLSPHPDSLGSFTPAGSLTSRQTLTIIDPVSGAAVA